MPVTLKAALVAAVVAALVAGGTATAASIITGKQIRDGSITGADIRNGSVAGGDIKNRSVSSGDLTEGALEALTGPKGPAGPAGPAGAPGTAGIATILAVESVAVDVAPGGYASLDAYCPAGMTVVGTGFYSSIADVGFVKRYGSFAGAIYFNNTGVTASGLHVQAICASGPGLSARSGGRGDIADFERDVAAALASK